MIGRYGSTFAALAAVTLQVVGLSGQAIQGPTEHTTCPSPFRPHSGLTFHGGYAWTVVYYTHPLQHGFAQYYANPSPAVSNDGQATWTNPGAYAECTLTWYYNPNGTVAYVDLRWHVVYYTGSVRRNDGCGGDGGGGGPVYMESYDPYAPDQDDLSAQGDLSVQSACGGGGSGGGDGGGGGGGSSSCYSEWMEIEISYDGGQTWHPFWSGWGQVCQQNET